MKRSMKKFMVTCAAVTAIAAVTSASAMAAEYTKDTNSATYTVPTPDADTQMTVLVIPKDKEAAVTDADIYYINQDGTLSGEALLKGDSLADGTYLIKVGYYENGEFKIAEEEFVVGDVIVDPPTPAYKLGDVDASGKIDVTDALWIAQNAVGKRTFDDTQKLAGDVDKSGKIDVTDALWTAQTAVGKRVLE